MKAPSGRRKLLDRTMTGLMGAAVVIAIVPLVAILAEVAIKGVGAVHGLGFFTQAPPGDPTSTAGGIGNAIVGTLLMVLAASVVFVPLGILAAVYLVEYGPGTTLARVVRFFTEVMTGIPSIIFGVFVFTVLVLRTHRFSGSAGALAIGLIMWPIVVRTSEEILVRVPNIVREASMALGIPKWKTILKVVLPSAAAGLTTGCMLAVARAAGETAPLLFTALGNQFMSTNMSQPISAMPLEIFNDAQSPYAAAVARGWATAFVLIALILVLTLVARFVTARRGG